MIYNLLQYLRDNFATATFSNVGQIVNGFLPTDTTAITGAQCIMVVLETGGPMRGYPDMRTEATFQFIVYGRSDGSARDTAFTVYNYLRDRHNVILPAVTGTASPAPGTLLVNRVHAIQKPYNFGKDDRGLSRYANNYVLMYEDGLYQRDP